MDNESLRDVAFADAQQWFVVTQPASGIFAIREPLHPEDVRSYLVTGADRAILFDTGTGIGDIRAVVDRLTDLPVSVVNSHADWDHIGANWQFEHIAIHRLEAGRLGGSDATEQLRASSRPELLRGPLPPGVRWEELRIRPSRATTTLTGGELLSLGGRTLEAIHAPGHSPGLLVFLDREARVLLSTDAVYPGPLYAQSEACNLIDYLRTLEILVGLAPAFDLVLPCHSGDTMPVDMIAAMRDAMRSVIDGRAPDALDPEKATHAFDGFAIYVPPTYRGSALA
jgi:glyoxylase-like metal-dependent hydrolase (beta-lactamase superfamily II)